MTSRGVFGLLSSLLILVLLVLPIMAMIPSSTAFGQPATTLPPPSVEDRRLAQTPSFSLTVTPDSLDVCAPSDATYNVDVGSIGGYTGNVILGATGHPAGSTVSFSVNPVTPPGSSTLTIGSTGSAAAGSYDIDVTGTATAGTKNQVVELRLFDAVPAAPDLLTPANGAIDVSRTPSLSWTTVAQAANYLVEVATDAGFSNIVYSTTESATSHTLLTPLSVDTTHHWRVTAQNACGSGTSSTFGFTTRLATKPPMVGGQIEICTDALVNLQPEVAYNSNHDEYLVVWVARQDKATNDIWARRINADGSFVEAGSFNVATAAEESREDPAVVYNPIQDEYLVAYTIWYTGSTYTSDILATRVSWDGSWTSGEITISSDADEQVTPAVAYNSVDDEYLVVYSNQWASGRIDMYAQRVRGSDGALLSQNTVASDLLLARNMPSVAYSPAAYSGNGGYFIAYQYLDTVSYAKEIRGKVAPGDLFGLYTNPEISICTTNYPWEPIAAYGDEQYLVSWWASVPGGTQVRGRRVGNDGTPQGSAHGFSISTAYSAGPYRPSALAHGAAQGYLVVWLDDGSGPSLEDVHGGYVMDGQDSAAGDPFAIDDTAPSQDTPSVACAPYGGCLVAYMWWNVTDWDIGARLVWPHGLYVPLALRNW